MWPPLIELSILSSRILKKKDNWLINIEIQM